MKKTSFKTSACSLSAIALLGLGLTQVCHADYPSTTFSIFNNSNKNIMLDTEHNSNCTNNSENAFNDAVIPTNSIKTFEIQHNDDPTHLCDTLNHWFFWAFVYVYETGEPIGIFRWNDDFNSDWSYQTPWYVSAAWDDNQFKLNDLGNGTIEITQ